MFFWAKIVLLHAGTPVVVSQATLTVMLVVLGILLMGVGLGYLIKSKEGFLQHRWSMSVAVLLTSIVIFLVMLPSAFNFFIDPDLQIFSTLSAVTIIHAIIGVPAITLGVIYALGDLPRKVKYWMRWAIAFWLVSLALGVFLFLVMLDLIPFLQM